HDALPIDQRDGVVGVRLLVRLRLDVNVVEQPGRGIVGTDHGAADRLGDRTRLGAAVAVDVDLDAVAAQELLATADGRHYRHEDDRDAVMEVGGQEQHDV